MAVSWLGGGAWTLVVLVLMTLAGSPCWASPCSRCPCSRWSAFGLGVEDLNNMFKSCPLDCNSTQIIDRKCKCLNLNTTGTCVFSTYLISGLEEVKHILPDNRFIERMIAKVNHTHHDCKDDATSAPLSCRSSVSPRAFINALNEVKQYIMSRHARKRK